MLSTSILSSIATVATILVGLAAADDNNFQPVQRKLQASIFCMMSAESIGDILDCCPAADEDDGLCTLIHCVNFGNVISLNDSCECGQIETACDQLAIYSFMIRALDDPLAVYSFMIEGFEDTCASVGKCCTADETANKEFDVCMDASGANALNFDKYLPESEIGGLDMNMALTQNDLSMSMPAPTRVSISKKYSLTCLL